VRLLAAHPYFGAHTALPWLALGWSLYGVYQMMIVITGRARATARNLPAAALGLAVNIVLLIVLVPRSGAGLGITGAALALCGAYVAMIAAMHVLTRRLFPIAFEWRRIAQAIAILACVAVSGELLLPPSGAGGFVTRVVWLALVPVLLLLTRFFSSQERAGAGAMLAQARRRLAASRTPAAQLEAYAEDPLRDL
jgi:O-antigen/teichoic acid export membrane protein